MKIAVVNSGSSSIKFQLFDMKDECVLVSISIEKIGETSSKIILKNDDEKILIEDCIDNHHEALNKIINILNEKKILDSFSDLDAVGHRVVHGGEYFHASILIDDEVIKKIKSLIPLAPLHNPANLEGILEFYKKEKTLKQIAVFDTAFHSTMSKVAYMYALPHEIYEQHKVRRYGFHGSSHSFVMKESSKKLGIDIDKLNIITLHLGNGASICAIQNGKSIDTSMGFTPLEGLVMGTRSGDIDSAIVIYLQRELGFSVDEVDKYLNKKSGLFGICDDNDVRNIINKDDENSKLAIDMMVRRIQKYIGSYMALLSNVDALVFTGGIGENSQYIREKVMNNNLLRDLKMLVIKTDEELEIARECVEVLKN